MPGMMLLMVLGWLVIIAIIAALVVGVWWLVTRSKAMWSRDRALEILRERYARGEISREEYESRRRDLAA